MRGLRGAAAALWLAPLLAGGCAAPGGTGGGASNPLSLPDSLANFGPALRFERWIAPTGTSLMRPVSVAVTQTGRVLVADAGLFRVMQFTESGIEASALGGPAAGARFETPRDIAVGPSLTVYVLMGDAVERRVDRYDLAGNPAGTFLQLSSSQNPALLSDPRAIASDVEGDIYVSDAERDHVSVYGPAAEPRFTIGSYGTVEGSFIDPWGVAVDGIRDRLYVADTGNERIQVFDQVRGFRGSIPLERGSRPAGLDVDSRGRLWVADEGHGRVLAFDETGRLLLSSDGSRYGSGAFGGPQDIAVSRDGTIFVADTAKARVGVFTVAVPNGGP